MAETSKKNLLVIISCVLIVVMLALTAYRIFVPKETVPQEDPEMVRELTEAKAEITNLETRNGELQAEADGLRVTISEYEKRIQTLIDSSAPNDEIIQQLKEQISVLNGRITALTSTIGDNSATIQELNTKIKNLENPIQADRDTQLQQMSELRRFITSSCPERTMTKTVEFDYVDKDGNTVHSATEVEYTVPGNISFAYYDLESGYSLNFQGSKIQYCASLIKLPYIYSVIRECLDFFNHKYYYSDDGALLYDQSGNKLYEGSHPNYDEEGNLIFREGEEKYDLNAIWTYDPATMFVTGSGVIKNDQTGTTSLTTLQLMEYAILYSDNIAFAEVQKLFGKDSYNSIASSIGATSQKRGFMQLSPDDAILWLKEIYSFIISDYTVLTEDKTYGAWLKDLMLNATFNNLIKGGLKNIEVGHKYGWDENSFHDMAIVFADHPYLLVIMTDLDEGSSAQNNAVVKFINQLSSKIYGVHQSIHS